MAKDDYPYPEIGARLVKLRVTIDPGITQKDWAKRHHFSATRLNNWELGARRIPIDEAELLCQRYGLTLDWIYRGNVSGLAENMRNVL